MDFPGGEGLILAVFILWREVPVEACVTSGDKYLKAGAAFRVEENESVSHCIHHTAYRV